MQRYEVDQVLAEIGAAQVPQLIVWNKIDLKGSPPGIERDESGMVTGVRVSALSGAGLDLLRAALLERFAAEAGETASQIVDYSET
jgi:GTP-binding protein HflX